MRIMDMDTKETNTTGIDTKETVCGTYGREMGYRVQLWRPMQGRKERWMRDPDKAANYAKEIMQVRLGNTASSVNLHPHPKTVT